MLNSIFDREYLDQIHYPRPHPQDITRFLDFDDAWLFTELKQISRQNHDLLRTTLAKGILYRNPLRYVIRRIAYSPAETTLQDRIFTLIEDLTSDAVINQIAQKAGIDPKLIFTDSPLKKALLESRFYPYRVSPSSEEEANEAVIIINSSDGPHDIARDPSTLVAHISQNIPKVIRIYTLKELRQRVG